MQQVTQLQISSSRRKYNDVVRKRLEAAGVEFKLVSSPRCYKLMVSDADFERAALVVLSVSHTNPKA